MIHSDIVKYRNGSVTDRISTDLRGILHVVVNRSLIHECYMSKPNQIIKTLTTLEVTMNQRAERKGRYSTVTYEASERGNSRVLYESRKDRYFLWERNETDSLPMVCKPTESRTENSDRLARGLVNEMRKV